MARSFVSLRHRNTGAAVSDPNPIWGFGSAVVGGSTPYLVTSSADSGAGTLRDALSLAGRYITFASDMAISLSSELTFPSNTTVDGLSRRVHTYGYRLLANGVSNIILRNFGSYPGDSSSATASSLDCFSVVNCDLVLIDRCSFGWSKDECLDLTNCSGCTIQRSVMAWPLHNPTNPHPSGSHAFPARHESRISGAFGGISAVRNLYALGTYRPTILGDVHLQGNVHYGYGMGPDGLGASHPVDLLQLVSGTTRADLRDCRFVESLDADVDAVPHRALRINTVNGTSIIWYEDGNTFKNAQDVVTGIPISNGGAIAENPVPNFASLYTLTQADPYYVSFVPELDAGPRAPDNFVLALRSAFATKGGMVVDHPSESLPGGISGLLT